MNAAVNAAATLLGPIGGLCLLLAILRMMTYGARFSGAGGYLAVSVVCFVALFLLGLR